MLNCGGSDVQVRDRDLEEEQTNQSGSFVIVDQDHASRGSDLWEPNSCYSLLETQVLGQGFKNLIILHTVAGGIHVKEWQAVGVG